MTPSFLPSENTRKVKVRVGAEVGVKARSGDHDTANHGPDLEIKSTKRVKVGEEVGHVGEGANPRRGLLDTENAAGPRDEAEEVDQVVFTGDMDPGNCFFVFVLLCAR